MASAYDEYERSLTGKWKNGLSPVAWVVVAFLGLFVIGGVAFAAIAAFAVNRAQEVIVEVIQSPDDRVVVRLDGLHEVRHELRNLKHELRHELRNELRSSSGRRSLRASRSAEVQMAIAQARASSAGLASQIQQEVLRELEDEFEGSMTFVVDGETLQFDMSGDQDGAVFLLEAGSKSYSLQIDTEGDGARLLLTTPDGVSEFKAGSAADTPPSWVPRYPGSAHPEAVFSGDVKGTVGGAELSVTEDSPIAVVQHLTQALEADGFEVRIEQISLDEDVVQGSLVGTREADGSAVVVVVSEEDGQTKVLTLWGDESIL